MPPQINPLMNALPEVIALFLPPPPLRGDIINPANPITLNLGAVNPSVKMTSGSVVTAKFPVIHLECFLRTAFNNAVPSAVIFTANPGPTQHIVDASVAASVTPSNLRPR